MPYGNVSAAAKVLASAAQSRRSTTASWSGKQTKNILVSYSPKKLGFF
ncbi:hypothetical protein [Bradyrhizobium sp. Tv2a-2]|nr:hypothetical protein [Bradyrhizobium sp. Tv2a-2]